MTYSIDVTEIKSGRQVLILSIPKNTRFLDETEGILADIGRSLDEKGIDTSELVKKTWKSGK